MLPCSRRVRTSPYHPKLHCIGDDPAPIVQKSTAANYPPAPQTLVKSPANEVNGIDWLAQQNGGQFDPVLFGDFRDPQDSILNNAFGDFFNDAFPAQDFSSPYNTGDIPSPENKRDLMKEIEVRQNGGPDAATTTTMGCQEMMSVTLCTAVFDVDVGVDADADERDRARAQEKVDAGEANLDDLCDEFKAKARCSITGAVIDKKDADDILSLKTEGQGMQMNA